MKRQIRRGVYETNSSSSHSITMCSEEEFEKWKDGKLLFDSWKEEFVDVVNLSNNQKEDARKEYESKKNEFSKDWKDLSESAKENIIKSTLKNMILLLKNVKHIMTT